jgi:elongation factor P
MIDASQLRNGTTFVWRDEPWQVLTYQHTHMGRGSADVRVKVRGLLSGTVKSQAFAPNERFEEALITKQPLQFLYREDQELVFMHPQTFEQIKLQAALVGKAAQFLTEGEGASVLYWEDQALGVDIPPKVDLKVVEADPGVKGNSATNIYKSAKLANGIVTKVPLFINPGDTVRIDTRTGEYVERVNK